MLDRFIKEQLKYLQPTEKRSEIKKIYGVDFIRELKLMQLPSDIISIQIRKDTIIIPAFRDEYASILPQPTTTLNKDIEILPTKIFVPVKTGHSDIAFIIYKEYLAPVSGWKYGFFVGRGNIIVIKDIEIHEPR